MAINKISEFPKVTPSAEDKILIEKNDEGGYINLSEMPVSAPVEKKISDVQKDLNDRITALAFKPGDTTGDAELKDIRKPATGFTVPANANAGDAVRAQVTQLDGKISNLKGDLLHLLKPIEWIDGGFVDANGQIVINTNYKYTDYIPLVYNQFYIPYYYDIQNFINTRIGLYDKNKNFVASIKTSESESLEVVNGYITYNSSYPNVYYARVCCYKEYEGKIYLPDVSKLSIISLPDKKIVGANNIIPKSVTISKCDFFEHDETSNFINGWIDNSLLYDGKIRTGYNDYFVTDYIELKENTSYYFSGLFTGYYAFYSNNNEESIIEYHNNDYSLTNPFTTPAGTKYARFQILSQHQKDNAWISIYNKEPKAFSYKLVSEIGSSSNETHCNYKGKDISAFNKCLCIGDSLTQGIFNYNSEGSTAYVGYEKYSYPTYLSKITGLEVTNKGISSQTSAEWYEIEKNKDLSGYDIAIIQLGVNDAIRYNEFGDVSKQAFTNIINKLKNENNGIKIFVANIIPAISYSYDIYETVSADILSWVTETYANDDSVIPLDIHKYGHTKNLTAYNCGHLSAYGYFKLAEDYKAYISWYMSTNPNVFRQIQFIGTNYSYSD